MSDADAREVIARAVDLECDCAYCDEAADAILATLKTEGYQLVKLEPGEHMDIYSFPDPDKPGKKYRTPFNPNEGDALALRPWEV